MKKRIFKVRPYRIQGSNCYCIDRYEWTVNGGLVAIFLDGLKCKSWYSLRELCSKNFPDGAVTEIYPLEKYN